jgi:riboflavin synthase
MFSGIIEAKARIIEVVDRPELLQIRVERPVSFADIKTGDSIATNGVCLTVENFTDSWMQFAIGAETLAVTGWTKNELANKNVNLERSLCYGDRLHGHIVSGHVEETGIVVDKVWFGESLVLKIKYPESLASFIWKKGSVAVQGVSLTVNEITNNILSVCLIPETLQITNLKDLNINDKVNLEADYFAKAIFHFTERQNAARI